jgi:heterodisulfide reductase subunit A
VPAIDAENCLHLNGKKKECKACKEACVFDAIDFSEEDEILDLEVSAIIVATGFDEFDLKKIPQYGYNQKDNVYSAMEFERLYAENGPTEGKLTMRDGKTPGSIGIIHCVGRNEQGYCSNVCCMYSTKFSHFLKHKLPEAKICEFHSDLCIPGKSHQKFYQEALGKGVEFIRCHDISVEKKNGSLQVNYQNGGSGKNTFNADMIILAPALIPGSDTKSLAETLGISQDQKGFFATKTKELSPVATDKEGIFIAGCAEGPKDIPDSITQAGAAVGKILSLI